MNYGKLLSAATIAGSLLGLGGQASAVQILTLENPGNVQYQQTANSPCVIGENSCTGTLIPGIIPAGNLDFYDVSSPAYTVQQISGIVGSSFFVGIDVNTTSQPLATEQLDFFRVYINNTLEFEYNPETPTQLFTLSNGNGYSDSLLKSIDLTGFASTATITFQARVVNPTDGREQFFLISSNDPGNPPTEIPEPGTTAMFGLGLLGMGMISLRGRKKQS